MSRDLWHIGLVVTDLRAAIAFYGLLGLEVRHVQDESSPYTGILVGYPGAHLRVAQLRFGEGRHGRSGHILELMQYLEPEPDRAETVNARIAAAHLAFEVDDMDALRPALESAGAAFLSDPVAITAGVNTGGRTVYLRDPDGFTLQLVEPPPAGP
jgi:catechol 2,3-dioxygenase-like lactoylglutathione lyase family enzyme